MLCMTKYMNCLKCSLKVHKCLDTMRTLSVIVTVAVALCTLTKMGKECCKCCK